VPQWVDNEPFWTPDLSAVIQEIVSRSGWAPDNALAIIVTGTNERSAWAYDGLKALAPRLYVEYTTDEASAAAAGATDAAGTSVVSSSVWDAEATAVDMTQAQTSETDEAERMQDDAGVPEGNAGAQDNQLFVPLLSR
jgi:hypothetical protein